MTMSHAERLAALRARLRDAGVDGFLLPRTDEHGSEYLPPSAGRVEWLTGFTGSAAFVVVLMARAAVFSDGRYTVQLEAEVDGDLFERCHSINDPPSQWLKRNVARGVRIGFDPFLTRRGEIERLGKALQGSEVTLVALAANPVDAIWQARPAPPAAPAKAHEERFAGESSAAKRQRIAAEIEKGGAEDLIVAAADSVAWLLNVRGQDIPYNPLCLSFAVLRKDGTCRWFVDPIKIQPGLVLDNAVEVVPIERFLPELGERAGIAVAVDVEEVHLGFIERLRAGGAKLVEMANPITLAKARKNAVEIAGAIDAQRRDGAAVVRLLAWLEDQPEGVVDELAVVERLTCERIQDPLFEGDSFPTIAAHGPNAALPHYRPQLSTNRKLEHGTTFLLDSGGQYRDATTDITRTIALGAVPEEVATRFTLVMKGHIAIATALFPKGITGAQLDSFARLALWRHGLDFDHGTGHGVGSYLCVHEGPQRISKTGTGVALEPGMIVSNEPGYYKAGAYGIRCENLEVVEARPKPEGGDRELLGFRTLTLCPFDRRLLVPALLTNEERHWVDAYHARVLDQLRPLVGAADAWLAAACAPL